MAFSQKGFTERLRLAEEYCKEYNCDVIGKDVVYYDVKLGLWYQETKKHYRNGLYSPECRKQLEESGIFWGDTKERLFEENLKALTEYVLKEKPTVIPRNLVLNGREIGKWLHSAETNYANGSLSEKHLTRLQEIGFPFNMDTVGTEWDSRLATAIGIMKSKGIDYIPNGTLIGKFDISKWAAQQRHLYNSGRLSGEKRVKLEQSGLNLNRYINNKPRSEKTAG